MIEPSATPSLNAPGPGDPPDPPTDPVDPPPQPTEPGDPVDPGASEDPTEPTLLLVPGGQVRCRACGHGYFLDEMFITPAMVVLHLAGHGIPPEDAEANVVPWT